MTATAYSWQFAFSANSSKTVLQPGFVKDSTIVSSTDLRTGDTIKFQVFDKTTSGSGAGIFTKSDLEPISAVLFFTSGVTSQTDSYPFDNSSGLATISSGDGLIQVNASTLENAYTTEFSAAFPSLQPLPCWTLTAPALTIDTEGHFLVSVVVIVRSVNGPTVQRTFAIDPEMVVGSIG